jgi:hypothetical protein
MASLSVFEVWKLCKEASTQGIVYPSYTLLYAWQKGKIRDREIDKII